VKNSPITEGREAALAVRAGRAEVDRLDAVLRGLEPVLRDDAALLGRLVGEDPARAPWGRDGAGVRVAMRRG
jgi:hypothetical protein